jgi:dTDP-4-dehydrorhamnose reductase
MKLVLFGSNGMLGTYAYSYLQTKYEVLALTRTDLDIAVIDEAKILQFLREHVAQGDIIINAAGITKQREHSLVDMIVINSLFPNILAKFKAEVDCAIIHITTDCVFNGLRGEYIETDIHDCTDDYGRSKSLGENQTITNIRTSIIGEELVNKKSLLQWVLSNTGKEINGYTNHLWNGVTCLELVKYIDTMIQTGLYWNGVRHIFSPDTVSKYELVSMINNIYDLNITIHKMNTETICHRNLGTLFTSPITKPLREQMVELKEFNLSKNIILK